MIETLLSCPWSIVTATVAATVLFAIAWGIPYAIVLWRDKRFAMAALGAAGAGSGLPVPSTQTGAGGAGGGQPPTIGGQQAAPSGNGGFEKMWKRLTEWLKKEKLGKNWLAFPVIMFGIILLITLAVRFFFPESLVIFGTPIRPWLLVFFGLLVWLFSRKADVEPEHLGVKKFFGKIVQKVGEGPALVPPGLFTLQRFPLRQFSIQIAAGETTPTLRLLDGIVPPESLDRCQELLNEKLEVNFAPPEQAKWTLDEIEEEILEKGSTAAQREMRRKIKERELTFAKDPANSRLTAEMRVTFIVRIDPKHVDDFARNIGTPEVAILELNELARAIVGRWCGKRTPAFVSRNLGLLGREILYHAEDLVGETNPTQLLLLTPVAESVLPSERILEREGEKYARRRRENVNPKPWGLDIIRTEVHALGLPPEINTSVADIAKSIAEARAQSNRADGEKAERTKKGIGDARAVRALNFASASEAGKFNVATKAAVEMVQKGNVVFSGANPVAEATALIKATLDAYQPPKAQPPKPSPSQTQPPRGGEK